MTGGYTKLFSDILTSSIWNEDEKTRILWITMLAMCDADGYIHSSLGSLAHMARLSVEDTKAGLKILESPDDDSRSKAHEGRRVDRIDGGWFVLNYTNHRNRLSNDPEAVSARDRKRKQREKERLEQEERDVTGCPVTSCDTASASVDASASKEGESEGKKPKKHSFGEFNNVKLTEDELNKLIQVHGNPNTYTAIEILDDYIESKGKRYKSHYAVLKATGWVFEKMRKEGKYKGRQETEQERLAREEAEFQAL